MTARLADFGVTRADLDSLVEDTLADAVINNTPVPPRPGTSVALS
jgi:alcohol dehydrogenase